MKIEIVILISVLLMVLCMENYIISPFPPRPKPKPQSPPPPWARRKVRKLKNKRHGLSPAYMRMTEI